MEQKPVYAALYAAETENMTEVANRLYDKLFEDGGDGRKWSIFGDMNYKPETEVALQTAEEHIGDYKDENKEKEEAEKELVALYSGFRMRYPRIRSDNYSVEFDDSSVKVFGTEDVVSHVVAKLDEVRRENPELLMSVSNEPVAETVKFQPKGTVVENKYFKSELKDFLRDSEEYREKGEISLKAIKDHFKDGIVYEYDPLVKDLSVMQKNAENRWNKQVNNAVYRLMVEGELSVSVETPNSISDYNGNCSFADGIVKKDTENLPYFFEVKGVSDNSADKYLDNLEELGKSDDVAARKYTSKMSDVENMPLNRYHVVFGMDGLEVSLPNFESYLNSDRFGEMVGKVNKEFSHRTEKIGYCSSPLDHQHWVSQAMSCLNECHRQDTKRYLASLKRMKKDMGRIKNRTVDKAQQQDAGQKVEAKPLGKNDIDIEQALF